MHRLLFFTLVAAVSAVEYPGPCPPVHHAMDNFDFDRYQGKWYEMARYPNSGEAGARGKCTTADYIVFGNVGKATKAHVVDGVKSYINGALTLIGPAKVRITYAFGDQFKDQIYTVLKTDYVNYSIAYSCRYVPENNTHQVFSWIKSRAPIMDQTSLALVNHYIEVSPLLDSAQYIANDHSPSACASSSVYEITDIIV